MISVACLFEHYREEKWFSMSIPSNNMSSSCEINEEPIRLQIKCQGLHTCSMGIKPDVQMRVLMRAYCRKQQLDPDAVQFLHGEAGHRVQMRDTPRKLGLTNGDEILVMIHQHGGASK